MNYILYQAYGNIEIVYECIFSILSILKSNEAPQFHYIVVYTDSRKEFEGFLPYGNILYKEITPAQIGEWRGDINFVHRVKIKIIQDFFQNYSGKVIYLDTDTVIKGSLVSLFDHISENQFVMHTSEGRVSEKINPVFRKLQKFISLNTISLPDGEVLKIPESTEMWNAGVLGLDGCNKDLLEKVLNLTDSMHRIYPKHIVEQFAFSYYMQLNGTIAAADHTIFHYWNFKEYRGVLAVFFDYYRNSDHLEMLKAADKIQPEALMQFKVDFNRKPSWLRKLYKLAGVRWQKKLKGITDQFKNPF